MTTATATTTPKNSYVISPVYMRRASPVRPALPRSQLMPVLFSKISVRLYQKAGWPTC